VVGLAELERKRQELDRRRATLATQQRQLDAIAQQRLELDAVADGIEAFCQTVRAGLATATFAQRRLLVELLIDRVVVTDDQIEVRYVLPTSPDGPHPPFCQLRKDHLDRPPDPGHPDQLGQRGPRRAKAGVEGQLPVRQPPPRQQPEPAARPAWSGQRDPGPVVDPRALGAIPGAEAPPPTGGKAGDQLAGSDLGGTLLAGRPQRRPGGGPPDGRTGGRSARTAARTPPPSSRPRPARPTSTRSAPTLTKRATYPTEVRLQY
jgi:hypothetical protein